MDTIGKGANNPKETPKTLSEKGMAMIAGGLSGKHPKWSGEVPPSLSGSANEPIPQTSSVLCAK